MRVMAGNLAIARLRLGGSCHHRVPGTGNRVDLNGDSNCQRTFVVIPAMKCRPMETFIEAKGISAAPLPAIGMFSDVCRICCRR